MSLRRWQRELGAPLDDTKEARQDARPELRTPLTDALILSLFRAQTEKIDALTQRLDEKDAQVQRLKEQVFGLLGRESI